MEWMDKNTLAFQERVLKHATEMLANPDRPQVLSVVDDTRFEHRSCHTRDAVAPAMPQLVPAPSSQPPLVPPRSSAQAAVTGATGSACASDNRLNSTREHEAKAEPLGSHADSGGKENPARRIPPPRPHPRPQALTQARTDQPRPLHQVDGGIGNVHDEPVSASGRAQLCMPLQDECKAGGAEGVGDCACEDRCEEDDLEEAQEEDAMDPDAFWPSAAASPLNELLSHLGVSLGVPRAGGDTGNVPVTHSSERRAASSNPSAAAGVASVRDEQDEEEELALSRMSFFRAIAALPTFTPCGSVAHEVERGPQQRHPREPTLSFTPSRRRPRLRAPARLVRSSPFHVDSRDDDVCRAVCGALSVRVPQHADADMRPSPAEMERKQADERSAAVLCGSLLDAAVRFYACVATKARVGGIFLLYTPDGRVHLQHVWFSQGA